MKVSYNWLQSYFDTPLPKPEELAELLTFHAFEIDGIEEKGSDTLIEVDVLANRGSDCLCHRGIAKEISVIKEVPLKTDPLSNPVAPVGDSTGLSIQVEADELVNRFSLTAVTGVTIGPSPDWLRERLETIGQKSINNIVDATNYVMFNLGQPLHAFDADKISGETKTISVRLARAGEKITTLTKDEYELTESNLLIVDGSDDRPLGIAGIKGGIEAEVTNDTTNIILEAANFNYISVRKTSQNLKLQTDASVRFQNQPARELTRYALCDVAALIMEIAGGEVTGEADWFPEPSQAQTVTATLADINQTLGTSLTIAEVTAILDRFGWQYEMDGDAVSVVVPWERKDIQTAPDVIEEIGRIAGYTTLTSQQLPKLPTPQLQTRFFWTHTIKQALAELGFSEVMTYALRDHGVVELENALASDKNVLRENLREGLQEAIKRNTYYAPLLGLSEIKIFEIGVVWKGLNQKEGVVYSPQPAKEVLTLGLAAAFTKKVKGVTVDDVLTEACQKLESVLGVTLGSKPAEGVVEINLEKLFEKLPAPTGDKVAPTLTIATEKYQPFSLYPFVLRDIAVWVPESMTADDVSLLIKAQAGELLVRLDLFDEFTKDGRTSYAFHLVFQSMDKTLSDEEINQIMSTVESALVAQGGEVR